MNLPNLPFLKKKTKSEYFLSLILRSEKASAVVFEEVNGKINVVGEHVSHFKSSLEEASSEELLEVIDQAVSTAERSLPEGVESQKTIFGVRNDWTEGGKIKKEYLTKLKKVSDELDFKPIGFLVISEAIAHLLQKEEGAPISAILAEIGRGSLTLSLFKGGKLLETKNAQILEGVSQAVDSALKEFTSAEILPSRIILFDGGNEKLTQEFMAHKWSKELGFLHLPQVTNLPSNFDARAVLNGAANQMGFDVLTASLEGAEKEDSQPDALAEAVEEPPKTEAQTVEGEDKTLGEVLQAEEFGFSEEDVAEKNKPKTAVSEELQSDNITVGRKISEIPRTPLPINAALIATSARSILGKIHLMALIKSASSSRKKLLIGAVPLLLVVSITIFYVFLRSAVVTLDVNTKETEKTENVVFSEAEKTDASKNIISAQFLEVSEDGKESTPTTGKKETGDKAKGVVTIFNNNDSAKTIPVGTVIISSNDLKFLTDKAVTVASASGDIFSGTEPGKVNVPVTAEKFGTNYNLPSNTKFSLEGTSSIAAKNDDAFSGGTKKDTKVVAMADQDKLTREIQKKLEQEAKEDILKKAPSQSVVLPNFISVTFDRKTFSKKVDEEADEVSLTSTITFEGISYKKSELIAYAKDKLQENIDPEMTIDEDKIEVEASDIKKDKDKTSAKVKIKAGLIPKVEEGELARKIAGKSVSDAREILLRIPEVRNIDINVFLNLPLLPKNLPFSSGKIKIKVNKNG